MTVTDQGHLEPDVIFELAAGDRSDPHLSDCPACSQQYQNARALLAAPPRQSPITLPVRAAMGSPAPTAKRDRGPLMLGLGILVGLLVASLVYFLFLRGDSAPQATDPVEQPSAVPGQPDGSAGVPGNSDEATKPKAEKESVDLLNNIDGTTIRAKVTETGAIPTGDTANTSGEVTTTTVVIQDVNDVLQLQGATVTGVTLDGSPMSQGASDREWVTQASAQGEVVVDTTSGARYSGQLGGGSS